jgi:hypothetical protein
LIFMVAARPSLAAATAWDGIEVVVNNGTNHG